MQRLLHDDKDKLVELDKVTNHVDAMLVCENGLDGETLQVNYNASKSEILSVSMVEFLALSGF